MYIVVPMWEKSLDPPIVRSGVHPHLDNLAIAKPCLIDRLPEADDSSWTRPATHTPEGPVCAGS